MERTDEDRYTDLLRHLGNPSVPDPEALIASLRAVERTFALGHITEWQLEKAKDAYAETLSREPEQAPPTGAGELGP